MQQQVNTRRRNHVPGVRRGQWSGAGPGRPEADFGGGLSGVAGNGDRDEGLSPRGGILRTISRLRYVWFVLSVAITIQK